MRIAFFNCLQRSIPPKKSGGIEKIIFYLAKGLSERGNQITLFSTADSNFSEKITLYSTFPHSIEDEDLSFQNKEVLNKRKTQELGKILLERQNEFDIIHNHCLEAALPVLRKIKITHLSTVHEEVNDSFLSRIWNMPDEILVTPSQSQKQKIKKRNNLFQIYHGIDLNNLPKPRDPLPFVIFVGRISPQKNPHLAILAARKIKKKLIILGKFKGKNGEKKYYLNTFLPVLKENIKWVEWLGEVKEKEVYQFLNQAEALLLPVNFEEPFGLAAIEAMAVGCPVIAFRRGAYPETIIDKKTGFLVNNLEEMVKAIPKTSNLNRFDCFNHIKENFSKEKMINQYEKLYLKLIEKNQKKQHHKKSLFLKHPWPKKLF